MNQFRKGTPAFGIVLGILFAIIGVLLLSIGFWKTLLLAALFLAGYFLGAVENPEKALKNTANRLIPRREQETIDLKSELKKEQQVKVFEMERQAEVAARNAAREVEE